MGTIQLVHLDENQMRWKEKALKSIKKYQQGALYLATGIGKSYVAKDIINDYLTEDKSAQILWLAPASAMNNIKQNFFGTYENIIFESFENIRIREDYIDSVDINNLKLIVIDEAHKALATKTWLSVNYILEKFTDRRTRSEYKRAKKNKADLLVLTASGVRSCDSRKVFDELTNRLEEHVDYEVVDLHEAIEQDLLGKIHFLKNNLSKYELMAGALISQLSNTELDESFSEKRKEIQDILDYIAEYKSNMQKYLGADINAKIKNTYDATEGDQWVVFYSRVKDAMSSTKFLTELFKEIYKHNPNVKVNVYQYHNAMSELEINTVNSHMYTKPERDTVNVYVTVNKGITSIHPENVVGEIQFRTTYSQNLYEQSIGRVTKSKQHSNREVYVVDVVDNANRVVKDGYGSKSDIKHIEEIEKTEQNLVDKLREDFLNNIDFETVNTKFDKIIKEFGILKELSDITTTVTKIADVIDAECGEDFKYKLYKSPYSIIGSSQLLERQDAVNLNGVLKLLQQKFVSGEFGRHTVDTLSEASPLYNMIIEKLGYIIFVTSETVGNIELYKMLIDMAEVVKSKKLNREYKNNLEKLRLMYIKGELSKPLVEFCHFNNINLRGSGEDLLRLAVSLGVIKSNYVLKTFSDLSKKMAKAENGTEQDLVRAYAMYYYVSTRFSSTILMRAINLTYECIDRFDDILVSDSIKTWITSLDQIYRLDRLYPGETVDEEIRKHINIGTADIELARLALAVETARNFTDFEIEILKFYDINVLSGNRNVLIDKIMGLTSISTLVTRLEDESTEESNRNSYMRSIKDININKMPSRWSARLRDILDKAETDTKDEEIDTTEIINTCREKIDRLEFMCDVKPSDIEQIKRTYKRAQRLKLGNAVLLSTCFPTLYIDQFIPAVERMKDNSMTFDDFLAVNGTLEIGDSYIDKVAFLLKFELVDNEYFDVAKKLITKQLEFV